MTDEEVDLLVSGLEDQQGQINYEGIVYKDKNVDMTPLSYICCLSYSRLNKTDKSALSSLLTGCM